MHTVQVWRFDIRTANDALLQQLLLTLTEAEVAKANRFVQPLHQQRSILARGLLRKILSQLLNQSPKKIQLTENGFGKPQLLNQEYEFNLSHAGDWIVYAITQSGRIGIDIEQMKPRDNFVELAKHFATDAELAELRANETPEHFYQLWTAKEAVIKGLGKGFYADTRQFSVLLGSDTVMTSDNQTWVLRSFSPAKDYRGCIACDFVPDEIIQHSIRVLLALGVNENFYRDLKRN